MQLSTKQIEALNAICEALIPSIDQTNDKDGYWKRSPQDLDLAPKIIKIIEGQADEEQAEFNQLLNLLSSRFLGLTWWGALKSAPNLSIQQREKLLQSWSTSKFNPLRKGFVTLKKLAGYLYYGYSETTHNPNWKSLNYPGPLVGPRRGIQPIKTLKVSSEKTLDCDTVIIGSGAGGGVVAGILAKAGQKVIVLEKGNYLANYQMNQKECEMIGKLYEQGGALVSQDGGTTVFAGSCLGGGTTVNWTGAFRTPDHVLHEWATEHDNPHFIDKDYKNCFKAVEKRTNVNTHSSPHNHQNQTIVNASKTLGYHCDTIPRNVKGCHYNDCHQCGYCTFGCSYANKQSTTQTFLYDAFEQGAIIMANTEVERITIQNGTAKGVVAYHTDENGDEWQIRVNAKKVVVSAGSIHTPALLLRSGLQHPQIGKNLYLHPTVPIIGLYEEECTPWFGSMMSAVSNEFTELNGHYGFKMETPPIHVGTFALALPWLSGKQYKEDMLAASNSSALISLVRDRDGGSITLNKKARPVINYTLSAFDKLHLIKGMQEGIRMHAANGALEARVLHNQMLQYNPQTDNIDEFLAKIPHKKWDTNHFQLFTAHQMGTCRMGGNSKNSPLKPNGESWEVKNLFVADASTFPSASGANPMLSIQAIAYYIAQGLT